MIECSDNQHVIREFLRLQFSGLDPIGLLGYRSTAVDSRPGMLEEFRSIVSQLGYEVMVLDREEVVEDDYVHPSSSYLVMVRLTGDPLVVHRPFGFNRFWLGLIIEISADSNESPCVKFHGD